MNRRGFLAGILASGVAPAAIGSGILMPVRPLYLTSGLIVPHALNFQMVSYFDEDWEHAIQVYAGNIAKQIDDDLLALYSKE